MRMLYAVIVLLVTTAIGQDTTLYYLNWNRLHPGFPVVKDSVRDKAYTEIRYGNDQPRVILHYDSSGTLESYLENEYDIHGNHTVQRLYYANHVIKEETFFQNDLKDMVLFHKVFGENFRPSNSNFLIRREFNPEGRETGYFIIGVKGQLICHRITEYLPDNRKKRELLRDDLNGHVITERRYSYDDEKQRTILEEYDGQGKLLQKVVLFDHQDFPE